MPHSVQPRQDTEALVGNRVPRQVERLRTMARLLDNAIAIPGTRYRFGFDAVIGLVPGIGDAIGAVFSAYIVLQAARLGASRATLIRMMGNVALDTIVGEIPLLGDLFDAGWKANMKNMALLDQHLQQPVSTERGSRRVLFVLGAGLLLLLAGVIALGISVANLLFAHLR